MATILLGIFILISLIIIGFYFAFFSFVNEKPTAPSNLNSPVSVIVCAKNEAENLKTFLPSILEQDYPDFEVIIINDASMDNTLEVIEDFQALDGRVKSVNVQNNEAFWANKKYALTLGIKKAKNPYLISLMPIVLRKVKIGLSICLGNFKEKSLLFLVMVVILKTPVPF